MNTRRPMISLLALLSSVAVIGSMTGATAATKTTKKKITAKPTTTKAPATTAAPTTAAPTTAAPAKAAIKIVQIQNGAEPNTFDPAILRGSSGSEGNRAYPLYGALWYMDPKTKTYVGVLADSFTSGDGIVWIMKIRKGVSFTDGAPFDAAAVKAHWERVKDPATASLSRAAALQVDSIEVVDPLTLRVRLVQRNQQLLWSLQRSSLNYVPSPKAMANPASFATKPVGAGPFMMKEFKRDDRTVLEANPDWPFWPGGKPTISEMTIRPIIDENQRFNNLATGQAQLVFTQFAPLRARAVKEGFAWTPTQQEGGNTIIFNFTRAPFDDARVRQAIELAIDLNAFKKVNCQCDDKPISNIFDDDSPYYDKRNDFPKYDLAEAQKLIDDYVQKVNGGRALEITLGHFSTTANTVNAQFFQAQLSQLRNLKVTLDGVDSPAAQGRVVRGNFGMHLWGNLFTDPDELYEALTGGSGQNWGKYSSAAMDSALNIGRASATIGERRSAYSNMLRLLNFDVPIIWYDRVPTTFLHSKGTTGFVWYNDGILRIDQLKFAA